MHRVLVIADCPGFRGRLRGILQARSLVVLEAGDVLAGLQRAVEDAPVLLVSGCDSPVAERRARRAGAMGVIPRVFDEAPLLERIQPFLALDTGPGGVGGNPARASL